MKTTTIWKSGKVFTSFQQHAKIELDPANGFSPKSLLLSAIAACSGIDVVELLEKMRIPFAALEIEAEAEQSDSNPRVFTRIGLIYHVKTGEEHRDKIKKAIDLSLQTYCGVAAMLRHTARISYEIVITS